MITIIKSSGDRPTEPFSSEKLYHSIRAACLSVRSPEGAAELTAKNVVDSVTRWLETRPEVTSSDLRRVATRTLKTFHPEAAYFYSRHKHIL